MTKRTNMRNELGKKLSSMMWLKEVMWSTGINTQDLWDFIAHNKISKREYNVLKKYYEECVRTSK